LIKKHLLNITNLNDLSTDLNIQTEQLKAGKREELLS